MTPDVCEVARSVSGPSHIARNHKGLWTAHGLQDQWKS
ncbi:unnamed protein product [Ixodes hexagonus]